jgi:hypothetical protein
VEFGFFCRILFLKVCLMVCLQVEGCNCAGWKSLTTGRNFLFPPSNASTSDNQMENLNEPCRNCSHTCGKKGLGI